MSGVLSSGEKTVLLELEMILNTAHLINDNLVRAIAALEKLPAGDDYVLLLESNARRLQDVMDLLDEITPGAPDKTS